ncbi:hypothetical protein BT93_I0034 [Corymbia citriodora subsp. variegata]|nr:hypothetical protein BT93_I0034 [Corymbia citriodora subsp. variegata]
MSSSELPPELVVEILKRLPVRSLRRFRRVSRSWRSTIDDPDFVALHLKHSALDASNWHLACLERCCPSRTLCFLFSDESPAISKIEVPFVVPTSCYRFVGSCNGLICITEVSGDGFCQSMYLWNLFTRKHKMVPQSRPEQHRTSRRVLGFGFDTGSKDYKIVRILQYPNDHHRSGVEIYSLNTDSWRSLERELPPLTGSGPAVFLNGNLHWFVSNGNRSIVLFNVASEMFAEMALSKKLLRIVIVSKAVVLSVLNDLLAVCTLRREAAAGHLEPYSIVSVWVMKEYGMPESWTRLVRYSFKVRAEVKGFAGFTRNGELLMVTNDDDDGLFSWNPTTGKCTNLPLAIRPELVAVVESLVSP